MLDDRAGGVEGVADGPDVGARQSGGARQTDDPSWVRIDHSCPARAVRVSQEPPPRVGARTLKHRPEVSGRGDCQVGQAVQLPLGRDGCLYPVVTVPVLEAKPLVPRHVASTFRLWRIGPGLGASLASVPNEHLACRHAPCAIDSNASSSPTREQLYKMATRLKIAGRSSMSKSQLQRAVSRAKSRAEFAQNRCLTPAEVSDTTSTFG